MKPDPMLEAIFGPDEKGLEVIVQAARRRRIRRAVVPWAGGVAAVAMVGWIALMSSPTLPMAPALPVVAVPVTRVEPPVVYVVSRPLQTTEYVRRNPESVATISTRDRVDAPAYLSDQELLALAPGEAVLVGAQGHQRLLGL